MNKFYMNGVLVWLVHKWLFTWKFQIWSSLFGNHTFLKTSNCIFCNNDLSNALAVNQFSPSKIWNFSIKFKKLIQKKMIYLTTRVRNRSAKGELVIPFGNCLGKICKYVTIYTNFWHVNFRTFACLLNHI